MPFKLHVRNLNSFQTRQRSSPGFTLVETIVAVGILSLFFAALAIILQQIIQNIGEARVRATALSLAQDRIERIRNLPYVDIGTIGGIPQGVIEPKEIVEINSQPFTVTTDITYIDDPFDGVAPDDTINTDYKRVRVEVTWTGAFPTRQPVTYVSNVAPRGLETAAGGGTLSIQVLNAQGLPVSSATVNIDNTVVNPEIHTQTLTDSEGKVTLPGSPACIACYRIAITKSGYSSDRTYSSSEVANPLQPYASILEGEVTQVSFAIDKVSTLNITSLGDRDSGYPLLTNIPFRLRGSKIIGYDTEDNPVYKYLFNTNTGSIGTTTISGLEWDSYVLDFSSTSYDLAGSNPVNPFSLSPDSQLDVDFVAVPKSEVSLLVVVQNSQEELLASASARLYNAGLTYDESEYTGATAAADFGQAFFGNLAADTYTLSATMSGYQEATASLQLDATHQEVMTLNPE